MGGLRWACAIFALALTLQVPGEEMSDVLAADALPPCCAFFDDSTGTAVLPCFQIGGAGFWVHLGLAACGDQVFLGIGDFGPGDLCGVSDPLSPPCCAFFDDFSGTVVLPCFQIGGAGFWAHLGLTACGEQWFFGVRDFGAGHLCGMIDGQCLDCSCPAYALAHPEVCGRTGDLNFRIAWADLNDVDIHVIYSSGDFTEEIYYGNEWGTLGGELDLDANSECENNVVSRAVENVVFDSPLSGSYTLRVCGYQQCGAVASTQVSAQVLTRGRIFLERQIGVFRWDDAGSACEDLYTYTVN